MFFEKLEGSALLRAKSNGTFTQADVYKLNKTEVFAKHRGGYIRLREHHQTSNPGIFWETLVLDEPHHFHMGRLVLGVETLSSKKPIKKAA
jgi:hypothetical protein